jgi:antitoxin component of RelBE/YafQ-DinJ toxin-antitoxin module
MTRSQVQVLDRPPSNYSLVLIPTLPIVYTIGMNKYAVINLKTDPELKKLAATTADRLGISISAVLNNELRRFTVEQSVVFEVPEVPNTQTAQQLAASRREVEAGNYHRFDSTEKSLDFLADKLK